MRRTVLVLVAALAGGSIGLVTSAPPARAAVDPHPDFDGDGFADLPVAATGEAIGGKANAGALHVFYGTSGGLAATQSQLWSQASPIRDAPEAGDRFGAAWAAGDFDGDGFDDLAVGVPGENDRTGVVQVLYGSSTGLRSARNQLLWQHTDGIDGDPTPGDEFGSALAAGDFDRDGRDDLAIGAPGDASLAAGGARGGSVTVLRGSVDGLTAVGSQVFTQDSPQVPGQAKAGDQFGFSLAVGDIDADRRDDLAIGAPGETISAARAGAVSVLFGTKQGLATTDSRTIAQGRDGVVGSSSLDDGFGTALAIGRFDHGPYADLAVGVPGDDVGGALAAGSIVAIPGGETGLRLGRSTRLHMGMTAVGGPLQGNTLFGNVLVRASFDGDDRDDLVVGAWKFDRAGLPDVGAIVVLYGGTAMLAGPIPSILVTQSSPNVVDDADPFDAFGRYVQPVDANGDGRDGLFVGVPFEDVGTAIDAGAGHLFDGSALGLVPRSSTLWTQDRPGVGDSSQTDDFFGGTGLLGDA
jgi:hypothetical protein